MHENFAFPSRAQGTCSTYYKQNKSCKYSIWEDIFSPLAPLLSPLYTILYYMSCPLLYNNLAVPWEFSRRTRSVTRAASFGNRGRSRGLKQFGRCDLSPRSLQILQSNSIQLRNPNNRSVALLDKFPLSYMLLAAPFDVALEKMRLTRQLVSCQTESISYNLLVNSPLDLKKHLAHGHSRRPVIKGTFAFTHTHLKTLVYRPMDPVQKTSAHLVTADVDTDIATLSLVQSIFLASKSHFDCVLSHLQLLGADSSVVVNHAQTIVAPNDSGALC